MRERLAFLAALLAMSAAAGADGMPVKNLAFEHWDEKRRMPEGWGGRASRHYTVSRDCEVKREDRCTLRIAGAHGTPPGEFQPLAQPMAPGPAAGHYLKLSGWIRTAEVEGGWAGLWARADVEGKNVTLENMHRGGPRGTSDWRRFEVRIPVASNATLVSFGVLLAGRGTAWFDGLQLAVDATERVGPVAKTQVVDPARPPVSPRLMDDAALALTDSQMPKVREHWREETRRMAQPVRSLTSDDFSDLQFLKPLLAGRRVVQLGESAHGVAEFNWLKVRLVKILHRELGFDVVAFESSLSACDIADTRIGKAPPIEVMRECIFPVWHSSETLGLFEYLDASRAAGRRISLAGFDTQNSSREARPEVTARLVRQVARDEGMADNLDFLLKEMYPGRKVVVWAHNFHIAKQPYSEDAPRGMGSWVAERRGAEVFTIGFYMGRGVAMLNNRSRYEIVAPAPDSLEAIMASAGWRASFVDLSDPRTPADSWRRMPLTARDWGTAPATLTPSQTYDGLIYIDTVTPPEYL
jgi:erythromycin esterase-like protein